ncbi:hypothetical protein HDG32_000522 [Paraburkholderia sp. CI2]|nr:hypothetical protein [Paraburkholderia sp. CI2]
MLVQDKSWRAPARLPYMHAPNGARGRVMIGETSFATRCPPENGQPMENVA